MNQHPVEFLRNMLEIYSPSGKEKELASFLVAEFKDLGFDKVWRDKVGNIYGKIGGGPPGVLLCGHMDTVPGQIPVKIEDGRLYGRGAVDAKSSLAAMILAASDFRPYISNFGGEVIVACVVDEEGKARGIKNLIREGLKADYAIFGEPSGIENITFAYKGRLLLKIKCVTAGGHVGAQHVLSNAIEKSFELWVEFKSSCEQQYKSPLGVFYSLTPTLIDIRSFRTMGGIPNICALKIDLRLPPTIKCEKAVRIVKEIIEGFRRENLQPLTAIDLKIIDRVEPYVAKKDSLVIKSLGESILEETGKTARLIRKTGTGDMNIFGTHFNIPVATYGPGNSHLSHASNEYIEISDYLKSVKIYKKAVEKIFKYHLEQTDK
ncbi:M20/M25/M40 family metallo-hydrolase [Candidatus Bathyarchaeota archaeon]|nr:M20/M25/M40 family metallo-hydrolase [Candidatus Bathyarchaeota archaeon]